MRDLKVVQPSTVEAADDEIDLSRLLSAVWRGKWLLVLGFIIGGGLAIYYVTSVATPYYPAHHRIALAPPDQPMLGGNIESLLGGGGGIDPATMNTETAIIQSRDIMGQLVDDLDLMEDPEFNTRLVPPPFWMQAILDFLEIEPEVMPENEIRDQVVDGLTERISVSNPRNTMLIDLSIETTDPEKSVRIVNHLGALYIEDQVRQKLDDLNTSFEFLSDRTATLEQTVSRLELQLASALEQANMVTPEALQLQNLQLRDLRERVEDQQERINEQRALVDGLVAADGDFAAIESLARAARERQLLAIVQQLRSGRITEAEALRAIEGFLDDLNDTINRSVEQLFTLEESGEALTARIAEQSEDLIVVQQIEREVNASRILYETLLTALSEISIQQGMETADARTLSSAVPRRASSPNGAMIVLLGIVLGGTVGLAISIIREYRFVGFRTPDELRDVTGYPVFGTLPVLPVTDRMKVLEFLREQTNSVFAEAVRNLRTSILLSQGDTPPQVILLTSSVPSEGKTTLAIAMARVLNSMDGKKAILVEADIRRKTLELYGEEEATVTLTEMLTGRVKLEEADLYDSRLEVDKLSGGQAKLNAVDLFASRRFTKLMETLRSKYDYIVMDAPPVLAVPDARVLASHADATIFVARWADTSKTQVLQGLDMLASVNHPADGLVMSQVDSKKLRAYGYAGQFGYDGSSSSYYNTAAE